MATTTDTVTVRVTGTDPFQSTTTLKRRNSMDTPLLRTGLQILPNKQSTSFPFTKLDLELLSINPQPYTSLKDLLPSLSAVQSPTGVSITQSMHEIHIRNHLVKQAAWAYLQPMSSSPSCSSKYSFRRMWTRFSTDYFKTPFKACFRFLSSSVMPRITGVFDRLLGALRVRINIRR